MPENAPTPPNPPRSESSQGAPRKTVAAVSTEFVGPLPPPAMLDGYNQIIPDGANRIMRMAESEAEHRRSIEKEVLAIQKEDLRRERAERRLGQIFAFVLCTIAILAGVYGVTQSSGPAGQIAGGVVGVGGLASLVIAFITGSRSGVGKPSEPRAM